MISNDVKLDFSDVLIVPRETTLTSRSQVTLNREFKSRFGSSIITTPIIAANMDGVGTIPMAKAMDSYDLNTLPVNSEVLSPSVVLVKDTDISKIHYSITSLDNIWLSAGTSDDDFDRVMRIISKYPKNRVVKLCIDVANGYQISLLDTIKKFRDKIPSAFIMAGNVVTPEQTEKILLAGADVSKNGIGSGSACLTRRVAGVGYPQLSMILECMEAVDSLNQKAGVENYFLCSDGGCTVPGDISKAFCAGADFVMLGSMLSGTLQSDTLAHNITGKAPMHTNDLMKIWSLLPPDEAMEYTVDFHGMSSHRAQKMHSGKISKYRASEGRELTLPIKGEVSVILDEIFGGLKSTGTYIDARNIAEFNEKARFIRVNNQLSRMFEK